MLVCSNCNHQQKEGKFCGACGTPLNEQVDVATVDSETVHRTEPVTEEVSQPFSESKEEPIPTQMEQPHPVQQEPSDQPTQPQHVAAHATMEGAATTVATPQPNSQPTTEAIKGGLKNYWNYFLSLLKNTSRTFDLKGDSFSNGMITLLLYAATFALSIYLVSNSAVSSIGGFIGMDTGVPFLASFIPLTIMYSIFLLVSLGCIFAMMKIGKSTASFKELITQFGGITVPFVAINVVAMLGGLIGTGTIVIIAWTLSFIGVFVFIPTLFIYEKLEHATEHGLRIHLSLGYIILLTIVIYIFLNALVKGLIDNIFGGGYF